jgi:DNA-binding MarR family transcriptional regulator
VTTTDSASATVVSTEVIRLMRQLSSLKAHASSRTRHGVEFSAYVVLFHLMKHGPLRSSALAEALCSDPSTVSRQTAVLVEAGLLERRPDPDDRRAVQLAATEKGQELFEQMRRERDEMFATVLADWADDDVRHLGDLLARFTTDLERHRPLMLHALTQHQENR